jgi:hypothetical protein
VQKCPFDELHSATNKNYECEHTYSIVLLESSVLKSRVFYNRSTALNVPRTNCVSNNMMPLFNM